MFEQEFIEKHINYVFKNWNVNYEDLDQDVEATYNVDSLPKSVEDNLEPYRNSYTSDNYSFSTHVVHHYPPK